MLPDDLRALPYLVHTNRELGLMLAGKKPLSIFGIVEGREIEFMSRYFRLFDRQVAKGRIQKTEICTVLTQLNNAVYRSLYYTLPNEGWRVEAMIELMNLPGAWSQERERRYGTLLGYEDWQNDIWEERFPVIGKV